MNSYQLKLVTSIPEVRIILYLPLSSNPKRKVRFLITKANSGEFDLRWYYSHKEVKHSLLRNKILNILKQEGYLDD